MGDARFAPFYEVVRDAEDPVRAIKHLSDDGVVSALAWASRERDPVLANVLATEALNRMHRATAVSTNLGEGVVGLDVEGRITSMNPAARAILGFRDLPAEGVGFHDLVHPREEYVPPSTNGTGPGEPRLCDLLTGQEVPGPGAIRGETRFERADGAEFPVAITITGIHREDLLVGLVIIFRDLTEEKRVQALLARQKRLLEGAVKSAIRGANDVERAKERFRTILESAPDGMILLDRRGSISLVNQKTESLFGYDRDEVLGQSVHMLVPQRGEQEAAGQGAEGPDAEGTGTPLSARADLIGRRKDGSEFPIEISLSPLDSDGGFVQLAVIRDVTGETESRRALEDAESRYRMLAEHMTDIMTVHRPDLSLSYVSPSVTARLGYGLDEFRAMSIDAIIHPDDRARARAAFTAAAHGRPLRREQMPPLRARSKDGTYLWFETAFTRLPGPDGDVVTGWRDVTDRTAAEERAEKQRDFTTNVVEHMLDPIAAYDTGGRIIEWGPGMEQVYGMRRHEVIGRFPFDLFPDQLGPNDLQAIRTAGSGTPVLLEDHEVIQAETGESRRMDIHLSPIRGSDGVIRGVLVIMRDRTLERLALEAWGAADMARREEERLGGLGRFEIDLKEHRLTWSKGMYDLMNVERGVPVTLDDVVAMISPEDRARADQLLHAAVRTGAPGHLWFHVANPDGSKRTVGFHVRAVAKGPDGAPIHLSGFAVDLDQWGAFEGTSPPGWAGSGPAVGTDGPDSMDAVVRLDQDGRIIRASVALGIWTGRISSLLAGLPAPSIFTDESSEDAERLVAAAVRGEALSMKGLNLVSTNPGDVTVRARVEPAAAGAGPLIILTRDVPAASDTRRMQVEMEAENLALEKRVEERTRALALANQELEAFSYSVSHDLRAPLRAIDYLAQAVREDYDARIDATGKGYLVRMQEEAQRMTQLVNDLLAMSQVTRGDVRSEPVDLSGLATEVASTLANGEPDRAVTLDIASGVAVTGDTRLLRIVLENLIGNAWKFTAKVAKAHIAFGREDSVDIPASNGGGPTRGPAFFVKDNGAGFDSALAGDLFRPFERLHDAAEFDGTGIGLATVDRIIARHGGRVWAKGEPGKGATFWFTLE